MKTLLCDHLQTIGKRIRETELRYGRDPGSVALLAVSKRHPVSAIDTCFGCGQRAFGENYAQEMYEKAHQLSTKAIEWHYIGPIQSNKTKIIAATAQWIHSIDRFKIARRISDQKPEEASVINVCLQVNVSAESSKSGVSLVNTDQLMELAEKVAILPGLALRGLMAIPAPTHDENKQRSAFAKVRTAMEALNQQGYNLDTLSMGMTDDMDAAIAEGATIVRIGTAIFGPRPT